jgi:rod shape-determining protein MreC
MKIRVVFFFIVLFLVISFTGKDNYIKQQVFLLSSPIKESYSNYILTLKDLQTSYFNQQRNISKLIKENKKLKKYLIEQTNYLHQIDELYKIIPSLERLPHKSIILTQTIGYTKLNSYNEIILKNHKNLDRDRIYGLMQNSFVIGTAEFKNGILHGNLISNEDCKFSVFIGKNKAPGIAIGGDDGNMIVKYIPKWSNIKVGDIVETSGLDNIFFSNVPVGVVKKIVIKSAYKTAQIKPHADPIHLNYLFLIKDPTPTLVSSYNSKNTKLYNYNKSEFDTNANTKNIDNTLSKDNNESDLLQTNPNSVDPKEHEIPLEVIKPKKKKRYKKRYKKRKIVRPKLPQQEQMDMF